MENALREIGTPRTSPTQHQSSVFLVSTLQTQRDLKPFGKAYKQALLSSLALFPQQVSPQPKHSQSSSHLPPSRVLSPIVPAVHLFTVMKLSPAFVAAAMA